MIFHRHHTSHPASVCCQVVRGEPQREKQLMEMIGSEIAVLRKADSECSTACRSAGCERRRRYARRPMPHSKGGAADRQKQIELTLLTMAAELKGKRNDAHQGSNSGRGPV